MSKILKPNKHEPEQETLNQEQAWALIAKSFADMAESVEAIAFIAEKWALKNKVITEEDLE